MPDVNYMNTANFVDFYIARDILKAPLHHMHMHRSYELYYLVKGEREYFIEDRFFTVTGGDLVLIPKKVLHRTAGEGGLRFLVHFTDAFLHKYFTDATLSPLLSSLPTVFRGDAQESSKILLALNAMLTEHTRATKEQMPLDEVLISGYLFQILFTMSHANNTYVAQNYADDRITRIIQYINENYNHINDIDQIAEHFFISKYHLCRFFQKNLGISLVSYLNTIKVNNACNLIKNGCTNMTQVAIQCGFNSSSYFCKVFKKEKGISPSEYKKAQKRQRS